MRNGPRNAGKSVAIYRCATTGDRKYPATPTSTVEALFLPLDRHAYALEGGFPIVPYEVYFDAAADVKISDKLVIDGTTYFVRRLFDAEFGLHPFKRCSIATEA